MLRRAVVGSLALVVIGTGVRATTVEELCGTPVPDPCRITTSRLVHPGSVLDFRPGALVVATASGRLDAGPGTMAIVARDVTLTAGGKLLAAGGQVSVLATGQIAVDARPASTSPPREAGAGSRSARGATS